MKSLPQASIAILFLCYAHAIHAQQLTQTIRGIVYDGNTQEPLIGAEIYVTGLEKFIGTVSDTEGKFILENVPVGRRSVHCNYTGYTPFSRDNLQLSSAKEYFLEIALLSGLVMNEVVITDSKRGNQAVNELSVSSVRRIDPEELQYHAATANDPSRLVMGFPGVQPARDNSNDIIIRGNSSLGLLWRLEGIDIPNPNHFATRGSSGGGITIFSASMLGSSDFSVGAFPAEYGNSFSGVFDMRFRNGNLYQREHTLRAGILGLDLATEGPIKEGKSSYLANFRYSTLGILNAMGLYLVGPRTGNNFQDFSFKIFSKGVKSQFSFWGIGGNSVETFSTNDKPWTTYSDYSQYDYTTMMGALGLSYNYLLNDKSYFRLNLAIMGQKQEMREDTVSEQGVPTTFNHENIRNSRISFSGFYKYTFNPKFNFKIGALASNMQYDLSTDEWNKSLRLLQSLVQGNGKSMLLQPYMQMSYRPYQKLTLNFGAHAMFFTMNKTSSLDPRLSAKYEISDKTSIALSYGKHSALQPLGSYFTSTDGINFPNKDLDMIRANHLVLALDQQLSESFNLHLEAYHQSLTQVPVLVTDDQIYWSLNVVEGFAKQALTSGGLGRNVGIDLTLEKFFNAGTFFMLSGSLFNSTFQVAANGERYNTRYNGRFSSTFTGGKTWQLNRNTTLEGGLRVIYNGGNPITPIKAGFESLDGKEAILDQTKPMSDRISAYLRPDLRIAIRKNKTKSAYWLALDIQNVINRKNEDFIAYEFKKETGRWGSRFQSTLTPILTFQMDF
ncbi:MAG: carboxypeptidase-like regulatory domain-containing protein [Saprospiraceae bacterium]|nr:carboxypeptidase-like regulatory domain-containing protein [Saprospiraceae bacterium]